LFQPELRQGLAGLLLAAGVDADAAAGGDGLAVVAVVVAGMRVVRVRVGFFDSGLVDGSVVGDLFNFRHLHSVSAAGNSGHQSIHHRRHTTDAQKQGHRSHTAQ
jgi:hypothetical protein